MDQQQNQFVKDYTIKEFVDELKRISESKLTSSHVPGLVIAIGVVLFLVFYVMNLKWGNTGELSLFEGFVFLLGGVLIIIGLMSESINIKRSQQILTRRETQLHEQIMMNKYNIQEENLKRLELREERIKTLELEIEKISKEKHAQQTGNNER